MNKSVPVIAVDGPAASGKGTIATMLARHLGFHLLPSGLLYRQLAYFAREQGVDGNDESAVARCLAAKSIGDFTAFDHEMEQALYSEDISRRASRIAVLPKVRASLLDIQRAFRRPPGLVAEGRDMGLVVFPEAELKIFLTASLACRAQRRWMQLNQQGNIVTLATVYQGLQERDARDVSRAEAPLKAAQDAIMVDATDWSVEQTFAHVLTLISPQWAGRARSE